MEKMNPGIQSKSLTNGQCVLQPLDFEFFMVKVTLGLEWGTLC